MNVLDSIRRSWLWWRIRRRMKTYLNLADEVAQYKSEIGFDRDLDSLEQMPLWTFGYYDSAVYDPPFLFVNYSWVGDRWSIFLVTDEEKFLAEDQRRRDRRKKQQEGGVERRYRTDTLLEHVGGWVAGERIPHSNLIPWGETIWGAEGPWERTLIPFLEQRTAALDRDMNVLIKFSMEVTRENSERSQKLFSTLLAKSAKALPNHDTISCPKCECSYHVVSQHGQMLTCMACSHEFVVVKDRRFTETALLEDLS